MMKWSFSGLKDFINCPRQYKEVKIDKRYVKEVTSQMNYGTVVHKALEDYARDGTPLPEFYKRYQPLMDALLGLSNPEERFLEHKMALTQSKEPCAFDAPDYWVRGIADFMCVVGGTCFIVDYKTGSNKYADTKQLKLMALMTFAHMPEVDLVKAGLLFVAHNTFPTEDYRREDIDSLWDVFKYDLLRLEQANATGHWPENPTGLCGWCPVSTCVHHRQRKK